MVVVATGGTFDTYPIFSPVCRFVGGDIGYKNHVWVLGVYFYFCKITAAPPGSAVGADEAPALSPILAAVNTAIGTGIYGSVHALAVAGGEADADAAQALFGTGKPGIDAPPGRSAIGRLEQPAVGAGETTVFPGAFAVFPEAGEQYLGVVGIVFYLYRACIFVYVQHFFPGFASVAGAEYASFCIRAIRMAQSGHKHFIRLGRVYDNAPYLLYIAQPDMCPGTAAIRGAVNTVSYAEVGAMETLACTRIQDIWMRRGHGHIADRAGSCLVKNGGPGTSVVICFPYSSIIDPYVEYVGLGRDTHGTHCAPCAEGADHPVAQALVLRWCDRLCAKDC